MKAVIAVAVSLVASLAAAQSEQQVQQTFDKALRNADGALLLTLLRPEERKGVSAQAASKFLQRFITTWLKEPGIVVMKGKQLSLEDPTNPAMVVFGPTGGMRYDVVDKRSAIFKAPTVTVAGKRYAGVGFAQMMIAFAMHRANSPTRGRLEEIEDAQTLFESWIPWVQNLGIQGSVGPEKGVFQDWKTIVKQSRAEIAKLKKGS